jgi:3-dehydroquinate dehydratase-2
VRVTVLNGVNLNTLARRDPSVYGGLSIAELEGRIYDWARELELMVQCRQTNHEGEFVQWCQDSYDSADALIVNPGAWSHYSYAIHDALEPLKIPIVEVHLSDIENRPEEWRHTSVITPLTALRITGKGPDGYREALVYLKERQ